MQIFVATSNPGKLRDFAWALTHTEQPPSGPRTTFQIEPLPGLKDIPPPPEDEPTFEGNARAKALYYAAFAPGQLVLADDSGLEVRCLNGAPGVRSARYAEDMGSPHSSTAPSAAATESTDERNNTALLRALDSTPSTCREARYRCALALARNSEIVATADGTLDGIILTTPQGQSGFGYDPLFFIPEANQTMAEIAPDLRLQFSHRGRALRNLLNRFAV